MYFLKVQTVPRWGDSLINLIHYEDAAALSCKILEGSQKNGTFIKDNSSRIKSECEPKERKQIEIITNVC